MIRHNNNNQRHLIQPYKLICPSVSPSLQMRNRLHKLLDDAFLSPVTCLCSPAGYGKSTLMVSWLCDSTIPYGWYSLDINDNDLDYFISHLITVLHDASNQACEQTMQLIEAQDYANPNSVLAKAMIEIAQTSTHFAVVLDDLHLIENPNILQLLQHWLCILPPQIHVFICCRTEPPIGLSRLRIQNKLVDFNASALSFNLKEVEDFLSTQLPFTPSADLVDHLIDSTGGWPAGLQLVIRNIEQAKQMQEQIDKVGRSFKTAEQFLLNEVLYEQPKLLQHFLRQICVFERFDTSLCQSLLPDCDCEALISEIEARQLFITQMQGEARWYRLHDIFRDALIHLQRTCEPEAWSSTQQHAVTAYLNVGQFMDAVYLCLKHKHQASIAEVLRVAGIELYRNGQFNTLAKLFDELTDVSLTQNPSLTLLKSWVLLATYREQEVAQLLQYTSHSCVLNTPLVAEHQVAQAQAAMNNENFESAKLSAQQAIEQLPAQSFVSKTVALSVLGQCALCQGELEQAKSELLKAETMAYDHRLIQHRLWCLCLLSDTYVASGNLDQALATQKSAIDMAHDRCIEDVPHMEFLYRSRMYLLIEQGDLTQAERLLTKTLKHLQPIDEFGRINALVQKGWLLLWRGQHQGVPSLANEIIALLDLDSYHTDWYAHIYEFLLTCNAMNLLTQPLQLNWHEEKLSVNANNHFYQHYQRVHAIQQWLNGLQEDAIHTVTQLNVLAKKHGLRLQEIKNSILLACWQNNEQGFCEWQAILPNIVRLKPLHTLWLIKALIKPQGTRDWPEWSKWFADGACKTSSQQNATHSQLAFLNQQYAHPDDQITAKEMQVLRFIGDGLNNDEIASAMHVAISTIKSHIRRLYRKLKISRRAQAIDIAQHLVE